MLSFLFGYIHRNLCLHIIYLHILFVTNLDILSLCVENFLIDFNIKRCAILSIVHKYMLIYDYAILGVALEKV